MGLSVTPRRIKKNPKTVDASEAWTKNDSDKKICCWVCPSHLGESKQIQRLNFVVEGFWRKDKDSKIKIVESVCAKKTEIKFCCESVHHSRRLKKDSEIKFCCESVHHTVDLLSRSASKKSSRDKKYGGCCRYGMVMSIK